MTTLPTSFYSARRRLRRRTCGCDLNHSAISPPAGIMKMKFHFI
jgi:hypothetical protein